MNRSTPAPPLAGAPAAILQLTVAVLALKASTSAVTPDDRADRDAVSVMSLQPAAPIAAGGRNPKG